MGQDAEIRQYKSKFRISRGIALNDGIDLLLAFEYYSITLFLLNYESHIDIGNLRNWVT